MQINLGAPPIYRPPESQCDLFVTLVGLIRKDPFHDAGGFRKGRTHNGRAFLGMWSKNFTRKVLQGNNVGKANNEGIQTKPGEKTLFLSNLVMLHVILHTKVLPIYNLKGKFSPNFSFDMFKSR